MDFVYPGERVLVTGGTGSLGHVLTQKLLEAGAQVRIFSRDEKKQYDMRRQFGDCEFVLGDIRSQSACDDAVRDVDVVIHGASLKYVNISEVQPLEYVTTNVLGTINLMDSVLKYSDARRLVGISSDKACLPVNAYGMTKAILEKLVLEGNRRQGAEQRCAFTVARYGNVVGTRGSVVPFWSELRKEHKALPVTNPNMTRFFFTLDEAVELVNYSLKSDAGLVLSKRMRSCTLQQLAEVMQGPEGYYVSGERPGEKEHEQLLTADEMSRTRQDGEIFAFDPAALVEHGSEAYGSDNAPRMSHEDLRILLDPWF